MKKRRVRPPELESVIAAGIMLGASLILALAAGLVWVIISAGSSGA